MATSDRGLQFHTHPLGYGAEKLLFLSQFPPKDKEIKGSSDIELPAFKKPRISNTLSNNGMQFLVNSSRTRYFKTRLCRNFRMGGCNYGSRCNYAHGIRELKRQVVTYPYPMAETSYSDHKLSEPCRMFSDAIRRTAKDNCHFFPPRPKDMNSREGSMVKMIGAGPAEHCEDGSGQSECEVFNESFDARVNAKTVLPLKTRICFNWNFKGHCPYGKNCRFAHGLAEMINMHVKNDSQIPFNTNTKIRKLDGYSSVEYRVMQSSIASTNASTGTVASDPLPKKKLYGAKCIFKRNELQKISRVYADWIEDVSPRHVHASLSEVH